MKIIKFQFKNKSLDWDLEELSLNKLTLLVGASGVGKTQILRSLMGLKQITSGESLNGICWNIEFETLDKQNYIWQGEFENADVPMFNIKLNVEEENKKNKSKIVFEKLFLNNALIIDRNVDKILFNGQPTIHSAFMQLLQLEEYQTGQEQI